VYESSKKKKQFKRKKGKGGKIAKKKVVITHANGKEGCRLLFNVKLW